MENNEKSGLDIKSLLPLLAKDNPNMSGILSAMSNQGENKSPNMQELLIKTMLQKQSEKPVGKINKKINLDGYERVK